MKATYQKRAGVFSEHKGRDFVGSFPADIRMTIPAREALEAVAGQPQDGQYLFARPPEGLLVVLAPAPEGRGGYSVAVRLESEPPYPGEWEGECGDAWLQASLLPCPKCGSALVWYEAGYVPGYRVCAGKSRHHVLVG